MGLRQQIHFSILEAFERIGVAFAFPTRRVWLAVRPSGGDSSV
jgi:small-conductance mechanosensitive channel